MSSMAPRTATKRFIGSSEFLNQITHEVILSNSKCELKITGYGGFQDGFGSSAWTEAHNMQARHEGYREFVKAKASKLPKKHPRCLADGNELLRLHGTTVACSLGQTGSSSVCQSEKCSVCRIIRIGFTAKKESKEGGGVSTAFTSARAFESIEMVEEDKEELPQKLVSYL